MKQVYTGLNRWFTADMVVLGSKPNCCVLYPFSHDSDRLCHYALVTVYKF